jgi:plasmid stabilization system protein ParE
LARLIYARRAFADLDRLAAFVAEQGDAAVRSVIDLIAEAVELLERHPQIGRPAEHGLRELVISRGKTGYVALYDYDADDDLVIILAIRAQREAGY